MDVSELSIGLELESNVIDKHTGEAVLDFNNTLFKNCNAYSTLKGFLPLQTEFDAATIEFSTRPHNNLESAFNSLVENFQLVNHYLEKQGKLLLLMGLHPARARDQIIVTDKPQCLASKPLMGENGGPLFYCGYQINLSVEMKDFKYLMPLCHLLQVFMLPCSVVTQSSPILANNKTNYKSFRIRLNDALSGCRSGPLTWELDDLNKFIYYREHLPCQGHSSRRTSVWYDILPKPIDKSHLRIEIRIADTTAFSKLYVFTQAMCLTFISLLNRLREGECLELPKNQWYMLNRESILMYGNRARITHEGKNFKKVSDYLRTIWRPIVVDYASYLRIDIDTLIAKLTDSSRADEMLQDFQIKTASEMVLDYARYDFNKN
jgi:carboxylate-amine ligase